MKLMKKEKKKKPAGEKRRRRNQATEAQPEPTDADGGDTESADDLNEETTAEDAEENEKMPKASPLLKSEKKLEDSPAGRLILACAQKMTAQFSGRVAPFAHVVFFAFAVLSLSLLFAALGVRVFYTINAVGFAANLYSLWRAWPLYRKAIEEFDERRAEKRQEHIARVLKANDLESGMDGWDPRTAHKEDRQRRRMEKAQKKSQAGSDPETESSDPGTEDAAAETGAEAQAGAAADLETSVEKP